MSLVSWYNEELAKTKSKVSSLSSEDLVEELLSAHKDYQDYLDRVDGIYWSQEVENIVGEIYYTIRNEVLHRIDPGEY